MKLIIEIPETVYEAYKVWHKNKIATVEQSLIANSKPYEERSQGKWIPVSEMLPEKNMACLVSVGNFNLTQIAMYSDLMQTINHKIFYRGDYGHENFMDITEYVKAWQPLPKPYESEDRK